MVKAIPIATYRLQLTKDFGFDDAAALAPYLSRLGISHVYASPFLKARPGSTHGYDIVDHAALNPELGGREGFTRFSAALRANKLALILDFVPNHMGVGSADNAWWLDVLEWGPKSPFAAAFDIDWNALPHRHHPGVLLPILGRPYGEALQSGEIELKYDSETGSFAAWYFEHKLPINPQRYDEILRTAVMRAGCTEDPAGRSLLALADAYSSPGAPTYRGTPALKEALRGIAGAKAIIESGLTAYRDPDGASLLHRLLERQYYRIAYWRVAFSAVNYRRFFDISDLAGLRVEDSATFRAIHALVMQLIAHDELQGLRLDHIDGLRDPGQYTKRLSQLIRKARREVNLPPSFYIVVEKILGTDEKMPLLPGVAGTTGYEWLNKFTHLLVDGSGLDRLTLSWRNFSGDKREFNEILEGAKRQIIETILASEFNVLCGILSRIAAGHFSTRDFTIERLRAALTAYVLEFPVYRTYVTAAGPSEHDRKVILDVLARVRTRWRGPDIQIIDFLAGAVTLDLVANAGYSAPRVRNFAFKLQQFTGPLMAKAMEDTAFYRYGPLIALNEVGGDPREGELPLAKFHDFARQRAESRSGGMIATATHDTKRGEDARMRIAALSELPEEWDTALRDWQSRNFHLVDHVDGRRMPTSAHEYVLYQAMLGAWPGKSDHDFATRMQGYAIKAAREGKEQTSWTDTNEAYERALESFVANINDPQKSQGFLDSFGNFAKRVSLLGALNSLSQLALKLTVPGVPDFYQGSELWDLSLVDPDNRRPVDYSLRAGLLDRHPDRWRELAAAWDTGRIKFEMMSKLLQLRRTHADLFRAGGYDPVDVSGADASHVVAFTRHRRNQRLVMAFGRHFANVTDKGRNWPSGFDAALHLPAGKYVEVLGPFAAESQNEVHLGEAFSPVPFNVYRRI